jgi:hypothetical protein
LCHKLGWSTFHSHQRRAEGSDPFFMGWRCTRCQNAYKDISGAVWEQCHVATDGLRMDREVQEWSHKH